MKKDFHGWVEIYGTVITSLATVVIAGAALRIQYVQGRQASDQQNRTEAVEIQRKYESLRDSRRAYQAQAGNGLVQYVIVGDARSRRHALIALAHVAPAILLGVFDVAQARATNEAERAAIRDLRDQASQRELDDEFSGHLNLARDYRLQSLQKEACASFIDARNRLPSRTVANGQVDLQVMDVGLSRCLQGNHRLGADAFQTAFAKIQTW